jgi:hypothetical protein
VSVFTSRAAYTTNEDQWYLKQSTLKFLEHCSVTQLKELQALDLFYKKVVSCTLRLRYALEDCDDDSIPSNIIEMVSHLCCNLHDGAGDLLPRKDLYYLGRAFYVTSGYLHGSSQPNWIPSDIANIFGQPVSSICEYTNMHVSRCFGRKGKKSILLVRN